MQKEGPQGRWHLSRIWRKTRICQAEKRENPEVPRRGDSLGKVT